MCWFIQLSLVYGISCSSRSFHWLWRVFVLFADSRSAARKQYFQSELSGFYDKYLSERELFLLVSVCHVLLWRDLGFVATVRLAICRAAAIHAVSRVFDQRQYNYK